MDKSNYPYDWSKFSKFIEDLNGTVVKLSEAMLPVISVITEKINEVAPKLVKGLRPVSTMIKLGEVQFVYWDYLTDDFMDMIISTDNINKTLLKLCEEDNSCKVNEMIESCFNNDNMGPYSKIFSQSVAAYKNGHYDLAAIGIISIFDGVLSNISGKEITGIYKRASFISDKIMDNNTIDDEEYATLVLIWTYGETIKSVSSNERKFNDEEPENLNRHWIMHGRSRRERTQLECIKLFNLLYGTLLIDEIGN